VPTTIDDFRAGFMASGATIREHYASSHHELSGFFTALDEAGAEAVPLFFAWALPGGTIDGPTADELMSKLQSAAEAAGELDGLLIAPHGAAVSQPHRDFDGYWMSLLRESVGSNLPIVGTLDLHANLSLRMVQACDALIAYRTNPHLDQYKTGRQAAKLILGTLRQEIRPIQAAAFPSVTINIEAQATDEPPCRDLIEKADEQLAHSKLLSNSALLGFPYADVQEMGSAFLAVSDGDRNEAEQCVRRLSDYLQEHRQDFAGTLIDVDSAVRKAADSIGPVCLLDMGDNIGGGSPGDGTVLLDSLIRQGVSLAFVCLHDPDAVELCRLSGPGSRLSLNVGGKTDGLHGATVPMDATVLSLHDGRFHEPETRHGGRQEYDMGLTAVVRADSGQTVMLTSRRIAPFSLQQLLSCGIDPAGFQVLVAKGVHAPVAAYGPVCRSMIRVNTPGVTTADIGSLVYRFRRRPLFPLET